ncbi:MAG: alpha/beta hydrolase [Maribacter sp.]|nr:alpha/beta hydrolase [Maribacter sp.]
MRTLILFLMFLGALLFQNSSVANSEEMSMRMLENIVYRHSSSISEKFSTLDLYYDQSATTPKKLLVFVHGGSWVSGDKNHIRKTKALRQWFINKGYAVAVPNFRLSTRPNNIQEKVTYREQVQDIARAMSWLVKNRGEYGIESSKILLAGYSSGAHLVALLSSDDSYLQNAGLSLDHIAGSISFDAHAYDVPYALKLMSGSDKQSRVPVIKHLFGGNAIQQLEGSPIHYIKGANVPPTLLISADPSTKEGSKGYISLMTAKHYQKALVNAGHSAKALHFDNETHKSLVMDFGVANDKPTKAVERFLFGLR